VRPAQVVRRSAEYLASHGVDSAQQEAEALLMRLLGVTRAQLYARAEGLDNRTARLYGRALCQRCKGTPLQHLTGEQQFLELTLKIAPGVFVPRPETESTALNALETIEAVRDPVVVDVGTGTGALALVVKKRRPDARVIATDLSPAAVELAHSNAARLGLEVDVRAGDLFDPVPSELKATVDLIVSNPPYITREEYESLPAEVRAEPYQALVGGTDVHRRLLGESVSWLRPGGWLVVEIGAEQGREVRELFEARLSHVEVLPDLAGRDRVVRGRTERHAPLGERPQTTA
jgi:release factor glutamine methyltransferase